MAINEKGDNIEFTAVALNDYTIYLGLTGTDTDTIKYPKSGNEQSAYKFIIRSDQNAFLVSIDDTTFTNPCKITKNEVHREIRDTKSVVRLKIRTTVINTKLKIRWF